MNNMTHPGGRPAIYTAEDAEKVLEAIVTHPMGLRKLCEKYPELPSRANIQRWIAANAEFRSRYLQAKSIQAHLLMDEIIDIVNEDDNDNLIKINRAKLKVDGYKINASRLNATYGDKNNNHNVTISEAKEKIRDAESKY
jgi:hypothetical protein